MASLPYRPGRPGPARNRASVLLVAGAAVIVLSLLVWWGLEDWRLRQAYPLTYRDLIEEHAAANSLDPLLVAAVIRAESNFWTWAVSPKGALGLMQIMPPTGQWIADRLGIAAFDDRQLHDPETNVRFGCWYLAHLIEGFGHNLPTALAAWNAGRTHVSGWLAAGRWSGGVADLPSIPFTETRNFVGRVLHNRTLYERLYTGVGD